MSCSAEKINDIAQHHPLCELMCVSTSSYGLFVSHLYIYVDVPEKIAIGITLMDKQSIIKNLLFFCFVYCFCCFAFIVLFIFEHADDEHAGSSFHHVLCFLNTNLDLYIPPNIHICLPQPNECDRIQPSSPPSHGGSAPPPL